MDCHYPDGIACFCFPWESKSKHFPEDDDSYLMSCQNVGKKGKISAWKISKAFPNFHVTLVIPVDKRTLISRNSND